ncbi:MAG: alpha/beta hydrolase domain-containing protein [Chloroflexi bacterium]|nr:alpha/beta hydrolase domain-containing protein [Chloroflexota bacterium]
MAVIGLDIAARGLRAGGASFGDHGQYEQIVGVLRFAVDPDNAANAPIVDLKLAPRDEAGRVRFDADVVILRPVDAAKGNRRLLFDVLNRGRKLALRMINSAPADSEIAPEPDTGNGFLMREGYTLMWCGWQHDIPSEAGRMALRLPQALDQGQPLRGRVLVEFQLPQAARSTLLSDRGHRPYPASDLNDPDATLTVRDTVRGERQTIARSRWRFARDVGGTAVPDPNQVWLDGGFEAGKIYEAIYATEGAPVIGLGLVSMRDAVSFLRYGAPSAYNPSAGLIERAYGFGASQSGRFLRHFLYLGLNEDEEGRQVFDGVIPHIAAHARGQFNHRFGQPSTMSYWDGGGAFPFADTVQTDPASGVSEGLLTSLQERGTAPKVLYTNSGVEYWRGGAGLIHTDPTGHSDLELPDNVRAYLMAGTQHGGGTLPLTNVNAADGSRTQQPHNSVDYAPLLRAAVTNLDAWVSAGVEPPASRVPRLADGTAVRQEIAAAVHAAVPGVNLPSEWGRVLGLDFGPGWAEGRMDTLPPRLAEQLYPALVSAVDADGNDVAGMRLPDLTVPLATYTAWNLRHPDIGAPHLTMPLQGSTLPFARTAAERAASGDPRPSVEERYASRAEYLEKVRAAAEAMVAERLLLAEDIERQVARSALRWDLLVEGSAVAAPAGASGAGDSASRGD